MRLTERRLVSAKSFLAAPSPVQFILGTLMPVFMYTIHAYRSWMPDHRRGYVERNKGIMKPDMARANWYHRLAVHERMTFTDPLCDQIIKAVDDLCSTHGWRHHATVVVWTHLHTLVSWPQYYDARRGRAVLKRAITTWLRDHTGESRKWLTRAGGIKRINDRPHFIRLMSEYLPAHRKYGGRQWYEPDKNLRRGRRS